MAALRSLQPEESVVTAAPRREWEMRRRTKCAHVCNVCGESRDFCVCPEDKYVPDSGGSDDDTGRDA